MGQPGGLEAGTFFAQGIPSPLIYLLLPRILFMLCGVKLLPLHGLLHGIFQIQLGQQMAAV
jgi:hypothetical protein